MTAYENIEAALDSLEYEEDGYIDEYQYHELMKKQTKSNSRAVKKTEPKVVKSDMLGLWKFRIPDKREFDVHIGSHDMQYKEQSWIIGERDIKYNIIPLNNRTSARAAAMKCNNTEEEKNMAENGQTRWLDIRTYEEAVPYKATQLGIVRLEEDGERVVSRVYFNNAAIEELKIKNTRLRELIESEVNNYVTEMVKIQ